MSRVFFARAWKRCKEEEGVDSLIVRCLGRCRMFSNVLVKGGQWFIWILVEGPVEVVHALMKVEAVVGLNGVVKIGM